jgi:hypothetical protein
MQHKPPQPEYARATLQRRWKYPCTAVTKMQQEHPPQEYPRAAVTKMQQEHSPQEYARAEKIQRRWKYPRFEKQHRQQDAH